MPTNAIQYDPHALHAWLTGPIGGDYPGLADPATPVAEVLGIDAGTSRLHGSLCHALHDLLDTINGKGEIDPPDAGWQLRPDVLMLTMWRTCDGDGPDGGAMLVATFASGVQLATRHIFGDEWTIRAATSGVDAMIEALHLVVREVNDAVSRYDQTVGR